jgi:hypothetical protein
LVFIGLSLAGWAAWRRSMAEGRGDADRGETPALEVVA